MAVANEIASLTKKTAGKHGGKCREYVGKSCGSTDVVVGKKHNECVCLPLLIHKE